MSDEDTIAEQLVKGSSITLIGLILVGISQFVLRIFLARGLPSKSAFGLLFSVFTLLSFINIFSHLGLNGAVTKFVSKFVAEEKPDRAKSSIISSLGIITLPSVLISITVIAISGFLASFYFNSEKAVPVVIILSIWFFFMSYHNLLQSLMKGLKDFFGNTIGKLVRNLVPLIGVSVTLPFLELDVTMVSLFYLLGPILSVILFYVFLRKRHSGVIVEAQGAFSKDLGKKMLAFGAPLLLSGIATSLIGKVDTMMLTGLRSLGDVGLYEVAKLSRHVLKFFGGALAVPLFPLVSELWARKEIEGLRRLLTRLIKFSFIGVFPGALIFFAFPEVVIRTLFGAEYLAASNAMRILAGGIIFWTIESVFVSTLSGIGKPRLVLKVNAVTAVFNLGANFLLIPPYGATGAAMATGMSFILGFALGFYYSIREIGFYPPFLPLMKIGVGGGLTLLLVFTVKEVLPLPTWPLLFIVMISGLLLYGLWIFWTKIIVSEDLKVIQNNFPVPPRLISLLKKFTRE